MMNQPLLFFILASFAGLFTIFVDITLRQEILEKTVERKKIPDICVQYRRTFEHYLSLFITGFTIFVIVHLFHLNFLKDVV